AQLGADGVGVGTPVERLDGAAQGTGLRQQLLGDGDELALGRLGEDPRGGNRHCSKRSYRTLSRSRNWMMRSWASPSSSTISPALRSSAGAMSTISWRAPGQPTSSVATPRSATLTSSTGLFLAAMIPLNEGYRGSTTPAVTLTTAGRATSTSSLPPSVWRWRLAAPAATS